MNQKLEEFLIILTVSIICYTLGAVNKAWDNPISFPSCASEQRDLNG